MVHYLAHTLRPGRSETDEAVIRAPREAKYSRDRTEIRLLLGLCNVYCKIQPLFSQTDGPLKTLLRNNRRYKLDTPIREQSNPIYVLDKAVIEPPVLARPKSRLPFSAACDAFDYQVRCAIFQTFKNGTQAHELFVTAFTLGGTKLLRDRCIATVQWNSKAKPKRYTKTAKVAVIRNEGGTTRRS